MTRKKYQDMYRDDIENYISQLDRSGNTREAYRRDLLQMESFLCENAGAQIRDYAAHIAEVKPASSVARIYSAVNGFCRYMMTGGKMDADPMQGITAPRVVKNPRPVFDAERKSQIVAMPRGYGDKAVRDRAMFAVMFDTGCKVTKLISLRASDVDSLALSADTKAILEDYIYGTRDRLLAGEESDMLFTNCKGRPMSRQGFWKILKSYTEEAADGTV